MRGPVAFPDSPVASPALGLSGLPGIPTHGLVMHGTHAGTSNGTHSGRREAQKATESRAQKKKSDALKQIKALMESIKQYDRDNVPLAILHMDTRGSADATMMACELIR